MKLKDLNTVTVLYLFLSPVIAIGGIVWIALYGTFHWQTIVLTLLMAAATGIGITAGYHRLFSHKSYEAAAPVRWFMIFFGGAAMEMSVIEWSYDHRNHHRYVDTDRDPYSINKGFWFAHIGWLFRKRGTGDRDQVDLNQVKDLWADPLIRFQHRHYEALAIAVGFIFPMLLAMSWGDLIGGIIIAGFARSVFVQQATFCINSVCHYMGKQPYSDKHTARDHWFTALATWGEGYHNYHHEFPVDYRNGIRAWQYDPTKWLIWTLSKIGLASRLITIPDEKILESKMEMRQKKLAQKVSMNERMELALQAGRESFEQIAARMKEMRKAYNLAMKEKAEDLAVIREKLETTRKELIQAYTAQVSLMQAMFKNPMPAV